jgi:hypothetical protein
MNKGLFASFDKLALRKNMMPTDLRDFSSPLKRVGLHYTLF